MFEGAKEGSVKPEVEHSSVTLCSPGVLFVALWSGRLWALSRWVRGEKKMSEQCGYKGYKVDR
jgi:hypothetical protein